VESPLVDTVATFAFVLSVLAAAMGVFTLGVDETFAFVESGFDDAAVPAGIEAPFFPVVSVEPFFSSFVVAGAVVFVCVAACFAVEADALESAAVAAEVVEESAETDAFPVFAAGVLGAVACANARETTASTGKKAMRNFFIINHPYRNPAHAAPYLKHEKETVTEQLEYRLYLRGIYKNRSRLFPIVL
jgi:hypothetical protein